MALFRKLFYRKPPDGLLEISERVYVFDCCFTTDAWEEQNYKGYAGGIITQLREHYPDSSILLFNFREGDTQSMIANALSDYDMTIMEYPRHYEGCPLLPMEVIHHFLRSCESWLSLGLQNLLLMHCERGGWPVLAFMLAALLIYRKQYSGEQKTLEMVYRQAPRELLQFLSPLNPMPSQSRYLQYISRRNVATEWPPLDRALTVDCVIIRMIPNFDGVGGCRPIFRIYGQDPFLVSDRSPKVLFSTPKKSRTVRHYKQVECELVKIDINCHIQGDVVLECISLHDDMEREELMFRVMFNTAFIRSNILMLNQDEIDILWDAKNRFPKDFRAEVIFSEMDAANSIVPVDFSFLEEKDGLPVEAFARVQEIFSSVDWAVPKGDAAVEVLQHIAVSSNAVIESYSHTEKLQEIQNAAAQYDSKSPTDSISETKTTSPESPFSTLTRPTKDTDSDSGRSSEASPSPLTPGLEDKIGVQYKSPLPLLSPKTPSDQTPSSNNKIAIGHSISVQSTQSTVVCDSVIREGSPRPALSSSAASSTEDLVKAIRFEAPPLPQPPPLPSPKHFSSSANVSYSTKVEPLPTIKTLLSTSNDFQPSEDGPLQTPPPPHLSSSKEDATHKLAGPTCSPSIKTPPPPHPPPPHLSSIEDATRKIAGPMCSPSNKTPSPAPLPSRDRLSVEDATRKIACPTFSLSNRTPPPAPPPPPTPPPISSLKEKSAGKYGPSAPAPSPFTLPLIDGSISRPAPSPPPPPPPPPPPGGLLNENLTSRGDSPFAPPPPPPPSVSTSKEDHSAGTDVLPSPLTPPLTDKKATRPAPPPPPPPPPPSMSHVDSSSTIRTAPPPPPPPSMSHVDSSSTIRAAPPPPPPPLHPGHGAGSMNLSPPPPPSPPPAPANSCSLMTSSPPVPIPPPPLHSRKEDANSSNSRSSSLVGTPSPPPPSIPPSTKGKSLLSRTVTSRNNQTKKLKPLHWLKITRAVSGSLWAEAQKSGEASKAPEIDISELESLFSASASNTDQGGSGRKAGSRSTMAHKPEKVQLIEHRRAYNCEIMLSKVKIPLHELLSSVLALEDTALDVDQVENVIKFCPTKEEMELLKGYKGEKDKLGKCEQFFLELMQVPRIESKLRVFSFKIQFSSQVADLRNSLNVVNSAADQIRGSVKLKRIMQTILSLGNALNQGTARGSAVGFKLDSLLKLTETRALNNKMTLMHYLCKVLADKLPELLDFWEDLSSLERSSKIQLKYLAEEMQATNKGLEKVVQELAMSENDGPVSDQFRKALKEFLCLSESEVRSLASLYSGVGRNVDALILYFGEDPARCPFEQVISTLLNFVRMFKKAHEENCKQLEFDKKKAKKEASAEKLKINASDTGNLLQSQVRSVK